MTSEGNERIVIVVTIMRKTKHYEYSSKRQNEKIYINEYWN